MELYRPGSASVCGARGWYSSALLSLLGTQSRIISRMGPAVPGRRPNFALQCLRATLIAVCALLGMAWSHSARADSSYLVQPGDTLSAIASRLGLSLGELARLNNLTNTDLIPAGVRLRTVPAEAEADSAPGFVEYRVDAGDTLSDIATRFGISVRILMELNRLLDEDILDAGAVLRLPKQANPKVTAERHRVLSGETLSGIAARYHAPVRSILESNNLSDPNRIYAGQLLLIPARSLGSPAVAVRIALERAAAEYGIDLHLLLGLSLLESGWQMSVVSPAGAVGLLQLMPDTARWALELLVPGARNWRTSATDNARVGAAVLGHLLHLERGDVKRALAAYYQGWQSIQRDGIYRETRQYVDDVLALAKRLQDG